VTSISRTILRTAGALCLVAGGFSGCKANGHNSPGAASQSPITNRVDSAPSQTANDAPPPETTGGFDGKRAFAQVVKQVGFGPRPSGSVAIAHLQDYLQSELKSYGCQVETDSFGADTPVGRLTMKDILVRIPGEEPGVILLGTHYDTKLLDNFVGADDGASSTAVMLELARLLCPRHGKYAVWIAFFDGEEAMKQWSDTDSRYGSRQMAARLAAAGDLKKIRAFLLADLVGSKGLRFRRESGSTRWLTDLVWEAAARLAYASVFQNDESPFDDDHQSFLKRGVPAADVIRCCEQEIPYWHTPEDTLDKISARSLAIVGHVFLESVKQLQSK
jgi:hypothetical protein